MAHNGARPFNRTYVPCDYSPPKLGCMRCSDCAYAFKDMPPLPFPEGHEKDPRPVRLLSPNMRSFGEGIPVDMLKELLQVAADTPWPVLMEDMKDMELSSSVFESWPQINTRNQMAQIEALRASPRFHDLLLTLLRFGSRDEQCLATSHVAILYYEQGHGLDEIKRLTGFKVPPVADVIDEFGSRVRMALLVQSFLLF